MPRFPRLFARKQADASSGVDPSDGTLPGAEIDSRDLLSSMPERLPEPVAGPASVQEMSDPPLVQDAAGTAPFAMTAAAIDLSFTDADPSPPAAAAHEAVAVPARDTALSERHTSPSLIGGAEEDIVPIIPDTVADLPAASAEIDDETAAQGAVDALMAACKVMVARVKALRTLKDGTQIVSGLIDLIRDLDERYAHDWGVVRRNGLAPVLDEVRDRIPEGDRFILESLEDERGGLTAEVFLRDLRTIAAPDRPRMVSNYAGFLLFVLQCILRQYLVPLQHDPARLRDVSQRLEYLVEGVRETLLARISGLP